MKGLVIVALLLAAGAIGASMFAKVETHGNYLYMKQSLAEDGPQTEFDVPLLEEYATTLKRMHMIAWIAGALAIGLAALALKKQRAAGVKSPLPIVAIVLGVAGAALSILSAPPWV